jgi:hypothetical protein
MFGYVEAGRYQEGNPHIAGTLIGNYLQYTESVYFFLYYFCGSAFYNDFSKLDFNDLYVAFHSQPA